MKTVQMQLSRAVGAAGMRSVWDRKLCGKQLFRAKDLEIQLYRSIPSDLGSGFFYRFLHSERPDRFWSGFASDSRVALSSGL